MTTKDVYFQGQYIEAMRDVFLASLVSRTHCLIVGDPGWGKTAVAKSLAKQVVGADAFKLAEISPMTNPGVIEGVTDKEAYLNEGKLRKVLTGTPYDPAMQVFILDEFGRGSDPLLEQVLHATDAEKQDHCTVWGTSNFLPSSPRLAAVLDRFPIRLWLSTSEFDVAAMMQAQVLGALKGLKVPGVALTAAELADIRSAQPTLRSAQAIAEFGADLAKEARKEGFKVNPRLTNGWQRVLFYNSVLHAGSADFDKIPAEAQRVMQFVYPAASAEESQKWAGLVAMMADKVGGAIESVLMNVAEQYRAIAEIKDDMERMKKIQGASMAFANTQRELNKIAPGDPRVDEAIAQVNKWAMEAMQGIVPALGKK